MAIYTIGTGGDFATIEEYKLAGITDGDTLDIVSDITESASTGWGNVNNITITSSLSPQPIISLPSGTSDTFSFGDYANRTALTGIKIENIQINMLSAFGPRYEFTSLSDSYIYNCILINSWDEPPIEFTGTSVESRGVLDFRFNNNRVVSDDASYVFDFESIEFADFEIYNNTILNDQNSWTGLIRLSTNHTGTENISIYNNIVYSDPSFNSTGNDEFVQVWSGTFTPKVFSHNLFAPNTDGTNVWSTTLLDSTDSLMDVDPLFVDWANGDYTLQSSSPAVGAGLGGIDMGWIQVTAAGNSDTREMSRVLSNPAESLPGKTGNTARNVYRGNPDGNVVDNSEGANPSRDTSKVFHTGSNLSGVARAPWLSGLQKY